MIEEIKLLLPVLATLTDGAFWGVMVYFGIEVLKTLLFHGFFFMLLILGYRLLRNVWAPKPERAYPSRLDEAVEATRQAWLHDTVNGTDEGAKAHSIYRAAESLAEARKTRK